MSVYLNFFHLFQIQNHKNANLITARNEKEKTGKFKRNHHHVVGGTSVLKAKFDTILVLNHFISKMLFKVNTTSNSDIHSSELSGIKIAFRKPLRTRWKNEVVMEGKWKIGLNEVVGLAVFSEGRPKNRFLFFKIIRKSKNHSPQCLWLEPRNCCSKKKGPSPSLSRMVVVTHMWCMLWAYRKPGL